MCHVLKLVVASALGALFLLSKTKFSQDTENRQIKLFLVRLYNALMFVAFALSFTTMILSTVASVQMLHGRFDPMAETAYLLLRREFDFEFVLTRWAFIVSLLCFVDGIMVRAFLEFDLLRKSKRNQAMCLVLGVTAIVSQMLSYINTHLFCWPNLVSMTVFVIQVSCLPFDKVTFPLVEFMKAWSSTSRPTDNIQKMCGGTEPAPNSVGHSVSACTCVHGEVCG